MSRINAQCVSGINAYSANGAAQSPAMARKADGDPSEFWLRLTEMWGAKGLPKTQNGIAKALRGSGGAERMSQGSVRRWFTGEGHPRTETLKVLADRGGTTIDYLLNGTLPKTPVKRLSELERLLQIWEQLPEPTMRKHVLDAAEGQLARLDQPHKDGDLKKNTGRRVA